MKGYMSDHMSEADLQRLRQHLDRRQLYEEHTEDDDARAKQVAVDVHEILRSTQYLEHIERHAGYIRNGVYLIAVAVLFLAYHFSCGAGS